MFYYNDEPECREAMQLEADKKWAVMYNGENSIPMAWEYEDN